MDIEVYSSSTLDFCIPKNKQRDTNNPLNTSMYVQALCDSGLMSQWVCGLMHIWMFMYLSAIISDPCVASLVSCGQWPFCSATRSSWGVQPRQVARLVMMELGMLDGMITKH